MDKWGRHEEAWNAYHKGFGIGSHRGPVVLGNDDEMTEAAARCGLMCEDCGLHADACECFYTARMGSALGLPMTLKTSTPPATVRRLLGLVLRAAQARH